MPVSLTDWLVPTYRQMLRGLSAWLDKAEQTHAQPQTLLSLRLAPDMFPLATQIRFACVQAQEAIHRLQGQAIPASVDALIREGRAGGDSPGTLADARARIAETVALLDAVPAGGFDGAADQPLAIDLPTGMGFDMTGVQYARDWGLAHFYFHLMTAYALLRHGGVELGKADYVAHAFAYIRPGTMPG